MRKCAHVQYPHGESNPGFRAENPTTLPEILEETTGFQNSAAPGAAETFAIPPGGALSAAVDDPDFAVVATAWPRLPKAIKAGILAVILATGGGDG